MSLRLRLTLLISAMFVFVLVAGMVLAVDTARRAVAQEVESTALLAHEILAATLVDERIAANTMIGRLAARVERRHLIVEVSRGAAAPAPLLPEIMDTLRQGAAPGWFRRLVEPDPTATRAVIPWDGGDSALVIHANPADEIEEAWREVRTLLGITFAFGVLANLLVWFGVRRALNPLDVILTGLAAIGQGDYRSRLQRTGLPELDRVVDQVNHIAAALEASRAQTRVLARRSITIQEQERRHLAHELHDQLGQSINAIKAVAVSIEQRAAAGNSELAASARTITDVSNTVYATVRGMMHRLRPVALDELGLVKALQQLVDDWNTHHVESFCALHVDDAGGKVREPADISIYRVIQEALNNAARHAQAQRVDVRLTWESGGSLHLRIADDGTGFEAARVPRGLGLLGMQERVEALNGEFAIESGPGAGTRIDIRLPVQIIERHAATHVTPHVAR